MISESPLTLSSDSPLLSLEPKAAAASPPPGELECTIETSFAGLDALRETWDEAVIRLGGTIYMSYDWVRTWWDFYGAGHELRLFVFQSGDQVVGIVPLYIGSLGVWPLRLKVARLVGANIPPKVFDPPLDPAWAAAVMERVIQHLLVAERCDLLSFGFVSELHSSSAAIIQACRTLQPLVRPAVLISADVQATFRPPGCLDAYLKSLSRNERKNNRRLYDLSSLKESYEVREDVLQEAAEVAVEFERFLEQHSEEWQSRGRPGHFYAWPKAAEFHRALVKVLGPARRVRFIRLLANGEVIASIYGFRLGTRLFAELPTRRNGSEWENYSLGRTIIVRTLLAAAREGITQVDAGLGHYDHKTRLGGEEGKAIRLHCVARRTLSRFRVQAWRGIHKALFLLYQKVWYRRVTPFLPRSFRRGQSGYICSLDF
jgi:CelD/BcsL family acetyltransferase involved in cellulose biosynthesis